MVEYVNYYTKVCIIFPIHGGFLVTPSNHLKNRGCWKCWLEKRITEKRKKKTNNLKIIKMEVISKEEYLKVHYGDRKEYFRLVESKLKPMKFSIGDVIHTIDYHYLEDEHGNDIDQEIMFVNPKVITGKYKITGFVDSKSNDYYCITILDEFGRSGSTAYVGEKIIFENYKNSNMI